MPTKLIIFLDLILLILLLNFSLIKNEQILTPKDFVSSFFKSEAQKIAAECLSQPGWDCFKKEFQKVTRENGLVFAENTLYALQDINPILRNCHIIAHSISQEATREDPSKWKELMNEVNIYSCAGGFLHGILETHMADNPDFKITSDFINDLCSLFKQDEKKRMCSHGLGHLILVEKMGNIDLSIPVCDGVKRDETGMALDCYIGLFMEDHQKFALSEHGIAPHPAMSGSYAQKLGSDCLNYQGFASSACWNEMAEIYAKAYKYDPDIIYDNCSKAPSADARNHCYLKGVALLTVYFNYDTKDKLLSICQPFLNNKEEPSYKTCLYYMISALMSTSKNFTQRGIILCSNIDEKFRKDCFGDLGIQLKKIVPVSAERKHLCQAAPKEYKLDCANP